MRADARRNYEALVATARAVFVEQGTEVPLEEIARRTGVGVGTLYRHFPSRSDLVAAVYLDDLNSLCAQAEELGKTHEPREAVAAYIDLQLAFAFRKIGLHRALKELLAERPDQSQSLSICRSRLIDIVDTLLARAQESGAVRPGVDGQTLFKLIHGVAMVCETTPDAAGPMLAVVHDGVLLPSAA
ncbi:MAG: TetR/AcrR family transcriptional regulator [Actinocrinis sp.]